MSETYMCTAPVEIKTGGAIHFVEDIIISAPTGKIQALFARLEAEYSKLQKIHSDEAQAAVKEMSQEALIEGMKALKDMESSKEKEEEPSVDDRIKEWHKQIKSSGFNLTTSYSVLKEILTKGNGAKMQSETETFKMESGHWDHLPMKEIKGILGFYIVNFIAGSD